MSKNAYAKAGVDVEAGYQVVDRIKKTCRKNKETRCSWWTWRVWGSL
ncbi:hypothetical protein N568_0111775 [Lactococcus garvieae TRF1]|uniref:Phosphoribosylformylglycinamidine cyclo-ligase n=1 Tax=Lactococcus garvieae TRF1 TaxID=1380772 RepID=V8AMG4_9LACT|nr:hypothetical protein N568_0111775 [Lactococcus garvieae TRF1]